MITLFLPVPLNGFTPPPARRTLGLAAMTGVVRSHAEVVDRVEESSPGAGDAYAYVEYAYDPDDVSAVIELTPTGTILRHDGSDLE